MLKFEIAGNYIAFIIALMSPTFFHWPKSIKFYASLFCFFWSGVATIKVKDITQKRYRNRDREGNTGKCSGNGTKPCFTHKITGLEKIIEAKLFYEQKAKV
jgi:hypothetical protein